MYTDNTAMPGERLEHSAEQHELDPAQAEVASQWGNSMEDMPSFEARALPDMGIHELNGEQTPSPEDSIYDMVGDVALGPAGDFINNMDDRDFLLGKNIELEQMPTEEVIEAEKDQIDAEGLLTQEAFDFWLDQAKQQFKENANLQRFVIRDRSSKQDLAVFTKDNLQTATRVTALNPKEAFGIVKDIPEEATDFDTPDASWQKSREDALQANIDNPQYSDNKINRFEDVNTDDESSHKLASTIDQTEGLHAVNFDDAYASLTGKFTPTEIERMTRQATNRMDEKSTAADRIAGVGEQSREAQQEQETIIQNAANKAAQYGFEAKAAIKRGDHQKAAEAAEKAQSFANSAMSGASRLGLRNGENNDPLASSRNIIVRQTNSLSRGILTSMEDVQRQAAEMAAAEAAGDEETVKKIALESSGKEPTTSTAEQQESGPSEVVVEVDKDKIEQPQQADPFSISQDQYQAMLDQRMAAERIQRQNAAEQAINRPLNDQSDAHVQGSIYG